MSPRGERGASAAGPTLDEALAMIEAARTHAAGLGVPMSFCVVDAAGHPVAFARGDGTALVTVDFAVGKAYTAAAWRMPTSALMGIAQPGAPGFGVNTVRPYVLATGGVPVARDGVVVGGFGASGGSPEQDEACALAGAAALG